MGEPKSDRCGSFTSTGWKRQHGGKDMPSNWRSPPRPGAKSPEQGRSYNRLNREVDRRRRVTDGFVVALRRGNARGSERSPAVCKVSDHKEGKDEMTKASIDLQDLRRRIYVKAKAQTSWKFWGLAGTDGASAGRGGVGDGCVPNSEAVQWLPEVDRPARRKPLRQDRSDNP